MGNAKAAALCQPEAELPTHPQRPFLDSSKHSTESNHQLHQARPRPNHSAQRHFRTDARTLAYPSTYLRLSPGIPTPIPEPRLHAGKIILMRESRRKVQAKSSPPHAPHPQHGGLLGLSLNPDRSPAGATVRAMLDPARLRADPAGAGRIQQGDPAREARRDQ